VAGGLEDAAQVAVEGAVIEVQREGQ
jgi:hypothetical protein